MNAMNISIDGDPIKLEIDATYYVIDTLYLDRVCVYLKNNGNPQLSPEEIKTKIFPYSGYPFAIYKAAMDALDCNMITRNRDYNLTFPNNCFDTDTGLISFIKKAIFHDFSKLSNYGKLVDSNDVSVPINLKFWQEIIKPFKYEDVALLLAPGIDSDYDFTGSGSYKIV